VVKQRILGRVFAPIERLVHSRSALVLSTSEAYAGGSAVLKERLTKVRALPLGLDLTRFTKPSSAALEAEQILRARSAGPLWLSVGRLVYYKGLTTAIDALKSVRGRLMIVGRGPLERELRARAADQGVAERVDWAGHVDDDALVGAYRAASALWFPSNARSEGFGLVQVEAMASGCPVINAAIPHSGVPWVSPDGKSGLTIPLGDSRALAAASRRLLDEPGLRNRLSRHAIERAHVEFDDGVMARRSLSFYESAISASAAPPARPKLRSDGGVETAAPLPMRQDVRAS
jgi:glycosyltransferase involved in cell wall biosynthesis